MDDNTDFTGMSHDFFETVPDDELSKFDKWIGGFGALLLYAVHGLVLALSVYTAAELNKILFAGTGNVMSLIGLIVGGVVMLALFLMKQHKKMIDKDQRYAGYVVYGLAALTEVVALITLIQVKMNGVETLANPLSFWMQYVQPAMMFVLMIAAGFVLTMDGDHKKAVEAKQQAQDLRHDLAEAKLTASIAGEHAKLEYSKIIANAQLNAKLAKASLIFNMLQSEDVRQLLRGQALKGFPDVMRKVGLSFDGMNFDSLTSTELPANTTPQLDEVVVMAAEVPEQMARLEEAAQQAVVSPAPEPVAVPIPDPVVVPTLESFLDGAGISRAQARRYIGKLDANAAYNRLKTRLPEGVDQEMFNGFYAELMRGEAENSPF